ncbi:hypothetical protein E4T39_05922 [Aureobasidium subglaciale]|nr:hypothetical protein E4T39_05922 [Aureobasidium subglaciale]
MNTSQFLELDVDRRATSPTPGTSLPEDDGMRSLRLKMHEIRNLAASTEEKARAMHLLMTRDYITMNNPDHEMPDLFHQGPLCHPARSADNPYNISPEDLEPSYCPDHINDEGTGLGCPHYSRNVKSAVNMELQWRKLDDEIRLQPMPEDEFEDSAAAKANPTHRRVPRKVFVGCNDCGGRGWSAFHWLGLKCPHCDGYNTTQTAQLGSEVPGTRPIIRRHEFAGVNALPAVVTGDEERADSAYGRPASPASPAQIPIPQQPQQLPVQQPVVAPHSPTGRSYFLQAEQEESTRNTERALTAGDAFRNLPYDILQRFSRSLSPMRYYLEGLDVSGTTAQSQTLEDSAQKDEQQPKRPQTAESREGSFWGEGNAGVFFGDISESDEEEEDEDGEEDEDEEEESEDEESDDEDDDDGVGSQFGDRDAFPVEDEDDLRLPGHM